MVREPWWHEHRCLTRERPALQPARVLTGLPGDHPARLFRDWLREHPDDLAAYRDAKLGAAQAANAAGEHVMDYNARKQPVIRAIYDRAFRAAGLL